jgi:hypothetical protein
MPPQESSATEKQTALELLFHKSTEEYYIIFVRYSAGSAESRTRQSRQIKMPPPKSQPNILRAPGSL